MDELELLKKDWNKSENQYKSFTDCDIYKMSHKKSSSIVKTLFYISVAEFVFWILINVLPYFSSETYKESLDKSYHNPLFVGITIFGFVVIFIFMYLLYNSYKAISTTDSAKKLMESILKTRKIIKYYVIYNLVVIFISVPLTFYFEFNQNIEFHDQVEAFNSKQMLFLYGFTVLLTGVFLLVFWLFYKLIYGILLKRLNRNYNELKKLEV
ncbi:hypothetical protein [Winogradskyella thalassocola]|uniref:Uncharacterized protein n=1 Tax=Winogradskyella thalassocola TaxID=262004 RepID=A0A1G8BPE1_9FLAO|nr:hypothetical protein [Winogradskyella thalassocola]SDH35076.1 hypothetical protein SAMN04489796_102381 [Winogradskyella thalassocola]